MEQIVTVEETQIKDKKCILLRIKGGKQFVLQCEVRPQRAASSWILSARWRQRADPFLFFIPLLSAERPGVRAVEERADRSVHRSPEAAAPRPQSHRQRPGRSGGALQTSPHTPQQQRPVNTHTYKYICITHTHIYTHTLIHTDTHTHTHTASHLPLSSSAAGLQPWHLPRTPRSVCSDHHTHQPLTDPTHTHTCTHTHVHIRHDDQS